MRVTDMFRWKRVHEGTEPAIAFCKIHGKELLSEGPQPCAHLEAAAKGRIDSTHIGFLVVSPTQAVPDERH